MGELPQPEKAQALDLLRRFRLACQDPSYLALVRRASKIDLYLSVPSKVMSLKEMVARADALQDTVDHPRLWTLRRQYHGGTQKNHGTPPAPRPGAHDQLPTRPAPAPQEEQPSPAFNYMVDAMSRLT
ncbi:hypothetical protein PTTG_04853 [Puccinia triticina 1-1 BBBD Race 1]|uniref:Uncharacterized protein n=2 Tax=Puccinia triticina TaxID=208348 RepID=A0A0C4EVL7_PUCT1|nr:uncharacterized protein PtA15_14A209 [Puccinia triticina]OAV95751.1 hypothetical protein PTTG_04853 [Puccinia triticina 1-1 BBBD Race 1]WAQ91326.1 hypothetical protein PtA15_14A209 [Puccinia triticina]WAR62131.1 hypothetical protein PtB15_14B225 [Puccinia triticina]